MVDGVEVLGTHVDYQLVNYVDLFEVGEFVDCIEVVFVGVGCDVLELAFVVPVDSDCVRRSV